MRILGETGRHTQVLVTWKEKASRTTFTRELEGGIECYPVLLLTLFWVGGPELTGEIKGAEVGLKLNDVSLIHCTFWLKSASKVRNLGYSGCHKIRGFYS